MDSILWLFITYFGIGIFLHIGVSMGAFDLQIQSRRTGEFIEPGTKKYEILKFLFCIGWMGMALQAILRGSDGDGQDN